MNRPATIRPVIDARSQFVGGFGCSVLSRCGRGSPASLLSHNRALCEQFGRDWVVGCSRWIGTTVVLPLVGGDTEVPNGKKTVNFHVFIGLSATLGVVSCKCLGELQFTLKSDGRFGYVQECVGDDRFVEGSLMGHSCIVNSEGEVVAELEGETQFDLFGFWVRNKKWLVRVEPHAIVKKLIVWRVDSNGVPVSPCGVGVRCTVPLCGSAVRISPFDPCGDVIVFVGQQPVEGHQPLPTISFVDLEKSIEACVTVVVSKSEFLSDSSPCDLIWASPSTILILCRSYLAGGFRVINTVTGQARLFSSSMYSTISTDYIIIPYFGVLCLSVSDFIQGLSVLVAQFETNNKGACEAAGSLFYYNHIASNYRCLHLRIVAIGSAIVPLTEWLGVHYGKGPIGTCWIGADPLMARFVLFYIGFWILFVITATMYTVIFSLVPVLPEGDSPGQRVQPRQFLFALSMIIIWVPCTINRVCESAGHPVRGLEYMQAIVLPLWG
ncbi:hypothetical protein Pelo_18401 [Pelomyxa schiedti]|nr:hypothetical protein Pelo_18401 [Pelomyxa schiedti]